MAKSDKKAARPPRIVSFGELMLRLKAPGDERLLQSPSLEATFGGAEANVAVSLAHFGHDSAFVTVLPDSPIGDAALNTIRQFGVDTRHVVRGGDRLGLYYLEAGANQRSGRVVYDRAGSSLATAKAGVIDWKAAFDGATWFHLSGITPAISAPAARLAVEATRTARAMDITVSLDVNYRANLWKYGRPAPEVMKELMPSVQVLIANQEDCRLALGLKGAASDRELAKQVKKAFPSVECQAITHREGHAAHDNSWSATFWDGTALHVSREYRITSIVDRVGAGDAFTAGLIHGLISLGGGAHALEFATAAGCLKHSIPGDVNRVGIPEIERLLEGDGSGRIQR